MKTLSAVILAVTLLAVPLYRVNAAGFSKFHHRHAKRYVRHVRPNVDREPRYPDASGWSPHDSNKLPFGSALWWDQMQRERRVGGESQ
jgi:hypothetical protein